MRFEYQGCWGTAGEVTLFDSGAANCSKDWSAVDSEDEEAMEAHESE